MAFWKAKTEHGGRRNTTPSATNQTFLSYMEWHMRNNLAPLLFDDHDKAAARANESIVKASERSPAAERSP